MPESGLTLPVARGVCYALFAYDLGLAIDLNEAERLVSASRQRGALGQKRRSPHYFEYQPAPLRLAQTIPPLTIGLHATLPSVDVVIYDFGAVSLRYAIPLSGPLDGLLLLGDALYDNAALGERSARMVEALLDALRPAVKKPSVAELVEDYAIYHLEQLEPPLTPAEVLERHAGLLVQILRAERAALSNQEREDGLAFRISYRPGDLALIDWNAALLLGPDLDDVQAVLEFANVELLEMRYLDDRLDVSLEEAYQTVARHPSRTGGFLGSKAAELRRVAELQTDSAMLYEGVNNALKLLGDQYLARVHRLVTQRFRLNEWDQSILRKLQTLESMYDKISDSDANRRIEILEWIIILLIAIEIVMSLVRGA